MLECIRVNSTVDLSLGNDLPLEVRERRLEEAALRFEKAELLRFVGVVLCEREAGRLSAGTFHVRLGTLHSHLFIQALTYRGFGVLEVFVLIRKE